MKKYISLFLLILNFHQYAFSQHKRFVVDVRNDSIVVDADSLMGIGKKDTIIMYDIGDDGERTGTSAKFVGKITNGKPTGIVVGYLPDDSMKIIVTLVDGERNGKSIQKFRNGKIYSQAYYKNDTLEGKYKEWSDNGQLVEKSCFKNGKRNGIDKNWYPNGQLIYKYKYKNGKLRDGKYVTYFQNGWEHTFVQLKNGKPINVFYEWNEKKKLVKEYNYADTIFKDFYENGNLYIDYSYKNKKLEFYALNGQRIHVERFKNDSAFKRYSFYNYNTGFLDIKNRIDSLWYFGGQLVSVDNYRNGKQEGLSLFYYKNGQMGNHIYYKNGKLDSISKFWYDTGKLKAVYNYSNGNLLKQESWYENGQMESELNYKIVPSSPHFLMPHSTLDGEYKSWDKAGNLTINKIYKDGIVIEDFLSK